MAYFLSIFLENDTRKKVPLKIQNLRFDVSNDQQNSAKEIEMKARSNKTKRKDSVGSHNPSPASTSSSDSTVKGSFLRISGFK